ncbi:hypothetical protein BFP97_19040 [Roseivirga sp. 4D4]|uniref:hypothetical protein n=1 Tax=Roseivirga sp. 4D4 TaxID=1889784 RepID=UPI000853EF40|nr:hypothetical protein [Roseivirga sp. 4D4]OEK03486.1 hypothetical protein BFP97_19040 [Roseivirga sp. 4D4]
MRRQSKIKLLRDILSKKIRNNSEAPPSGAFMEIQKKLSTNSRLKEILSEKFKNKSSRPPIGAFEAIQTGLSNNGQSPFWSRYKVHTAVVLLIIVLVSLLVIPGELRTNSLSTSDDTLSPPQALDAYEKSQSKKYGTTSMDVAKDNTSSITNKVKRSTLMVVEGTDKTALPSIELNNTDFNDGRSKTQLTSKISVVNSQANSNIGLRAIVTQGPGVDFNRGIQKAQMKPYRGRVSIPPLFLADWSKDSSEHVTYFQKRINKFFFEVQPLYNQLMIENGTGSVLKLSDNQQNLSQKPGFKVGGGVLLQLSDNLRLKTGLYYLQFSKQIEYSLFRSIQGLGNGQNPLFYFEGDVNESIESKLILGNIGFELDLYKNHYIGIEYDAGYSIGSTETRASNIGLYFSLAQFKLGNFRYILEPHVSHPLTSSNADFYSFRSNLVGFSLKVIR